MGLFTRKKKTVEPINYDTKVFQSTLNIFSDFGNNINASDVVKICIDRIASHAAKLKPRYVKNLDNSSVVEKKGTLAYLLKYQPNPLMTPYDFIYRTVTMLYLNNNAFIYPVYDQNTYELKELWPIKPNSVEAIKDASGDLYLRFSFIDGRNYTLPYESIIHMRRFYGINDIFGGSGAISDHSAILKTIKINDSVLQGIDNAIRSSFQIKGLLKINGMLSEKDKKAQKDEFDRALKEATLNGNSSIVPVDLKSDYVPLNVDPKLVSSETLTFLQKKIITYFGVSESIYDNKYTEDEYNAFYEGTIEGVGAAKDAGIAAINGVKTLEQIAAEELQAAKDDAKAELDNYVENPSSAVEAIIDAAKSEITDALDQTAIDKIVEDAKAAIDTKVAEEAALQAAKDAAIKAINDKVADLIESDYSPENWATIQEELADAIAEINSLETVAEVAASDVDSIKPKIDAVETIVETIARELAEAKADKIGELEDYVNSLNESDYSEENWAAIQEELADAIAEIDSLETVTEVDAYDVDSIKTKIDVIETLPQEESLNLWWIIITLLVVMIGEIIVIIFKKRSNSKLYSIAMPLFFVRIIPNGAWTIITILAIIVFALTAYIIYLFLKGKPKAQVVDVIIPVVEEKQNREIKDYSFKAKLHLAETETVENYDVLKNYILSFKDVTIRESWGYERFMYGGKSILKLRPSGKSLKIYINLDHKKYENTKFKLEDVSHKKIHETTPSLFVVTGPRKLIWAKELVEGYMNEVGAVKDENYIPKDYRVDRKTTKELIEKGLIKTAILNETYKKIIDGEQ